MKNKTENKKLPVIILHGWGLRGEKYLGLCKILKNEGYEVFAPDLPGFGSEPLVSKDMKLDDYVSFVKEFLKKEKISKCVLIGHSFGGRVALKFAWKYPDLVSHLILTGTPIVRNMSFSKKTVRLIAKVGYTPLKILPESGRDFFRKCLYKTIGEWDYYKSGNLKEVFKNIINEDLVQYIQEEKNPTLLIWGENDTFTPASDIKKIQKYNPAVDAKIVPNTTHALPYQEPELFYQNIKNNL